MNKLLLIGDNHLSRCHSQMKADKKSLNFDNDGTFSISCTWEFDLNQVSDVEMKFRELNKSKKLPTTVLIMCGGYDVLLKTDTSVIISKLDKLAHDMLSSGVKTIIVCSILDKWVDENFEKYKVIKSLNRTLGKKFHAKKNIFFINIRPHGQPNDFLLQDDHYFLKPEGYTYVCNKIQNILTGKVFVNTTKELNSENTIELVKSGFGPSSKKQKLSNSKKNGENVISSCRSILQPTSISTKTDSEPLTASDTEALTASDTEALTASDTESSSATNTKPLPKTDTGTSQSCVTRGMGDRLSDFKTILVDDYKRVCSEEMKLNNDLDSIQTKLKTTKIEMEEICITYKKLFGVSLVDSLN